MEEFPTEGEVSVGQFSSRTIRRRHLPSLRQKVGVVFQDFRLWRDWTIAENVAASLRVTGNFDAKDLRQRTQDALGVVGLAHRARNYPSHLSGGEQQRVAIARAIVNDPMLLLADEPTGNLDQEVGGHIFDLLRRIHYGGTSVIIATHDVDAIERLGGRVILLEQGRVAGDEVVRALG
jgi:cell division transport system ATP-binding protein